MKKADKLFQFVDRPWFLPFVVFGAAIDCFILVFPADPIMFSLVWLKPKRWVFYAITFAFGSAVGAASFDIAYDTMGFQSLESTVRGLISQDSFKKMEEFFKNYGTWALGMIAFGPFPLQPMVLIASISKVPTMVIFPSMLIGRILKNLVLCGLGSYAPQTLQKLIGQKNNNKN